MTKKIKTVYDNNPTVGNDSTAAGYSPFDLGTGTAEARSDEQLAARINTILGGTGNIPDPSRVSLTVIDDSLTPVIDPITGLGAYWKITVNDTTTPTGGGSQGAMTKSLSSWTTPETWNFWESDDNSTFTAILPINEQSNGAIVPGIDLSANDTKGAVWAGDFQATPGTDPTTDMIPTGTLPIDAGSSLDRIDMHIVFGNVTVLQYSDITLDANYRVGNPGQAIAFRLIAYDIAGNPSSSNDSTIVLDNVSAADAGEIQFDALSYSGDDDGTPPKVTAILTPKLADGTNTRLASPASPYIQVLVSTKEFSDVGINSGVAQTFETSTVVIGTDAFTLTGHGYTTGDALTYSKDGGTDVLGSGLTDALNVFAIVVDPNTLKLAAIPDDAAAGTAIDLTAAGTETHVLFEGSSVYFEKLVNEEYSWASGNVADQNVDIKLVKQAGVYNTNFQIEIDYASNTESDGSTPIGGVGIREAALCEINSSYSSSGIEGYLPDPVTGDIMVNLSSANCTFTDSTSAPTGEKWLETTETGIAKADDGVKPNSAADRGTFRVPDTGAQQISFKFVPAAADYYFKVRGKRLSWGFNDFHVFIDGSPVASLNDIFLDPYDYAATYPAVAAGSYMWGVHSYDTATPQVGDFAKTGVLTAAQHTMEILAQGNVELDAVFLTVADTDPSATGDDPGGDHALEGPAEAEYSTGGSGSGATDHPDKATTTCRPAPPATITPTLNPDNGSDNAATTGLVVSADFSGVLVGCQYCTFGVYVNGVLVTGTKSGAGTSVLSQLIPGTLANGATVSVDLKGTGLDTLGERKAFDTDGNWVFTAIDSGAETTLFGPVTFENRSIGEYTLQMVKEDFPDLVDYSAYKGTEDWDIWNNVPAPQIIDDPKGTRGHVLDITRTAGAENGGIGIHATFGNGDAFNANGNAETHAFFAFDLYHDKSVTTTGIKNMIFGFGTQLRMTHVWGENPGPNPKDAFRLETQLYGDIAWNSGDNTLGAFDYDAKAASVHYAFLPDNPARDADAYLGFSAASLNAPVREWYTLEYEVDMNTVVAIGTVFHSITGVAEVSVPDSSIFSPGEEITIYDVQDTGGGTPNNLNAYPTWVLNSPFEQVPDYLASTTVISIQDLTHIRVVSTGNTSNLSGGYIGKFDGVLNTWMRSPSQFVGAKKTIEIDDMLWRCHPAKAIDSIVLEQHYVSESAGPTQDEQHLYDNFRVSTTRITG